MPFDIEATHQTASDDLEDLAAVFAVEAMTPEERGEYVDHLLSCQVCQSLVGQFQSAANLLPDSLALESTSPDLKQSILAEASLDLQLSSPETAQRPQSLKQGWLDWFWPPRMSPIPAAVMAVLLLVVLGLGAWNMALQREISERDIILLQHQEVIRAITSGGQIHQVSGTEAAPTAAAVLINRSGADGSVLIITGLPALPLGFEYQVWRIMDDAEAPVSAAIFSISETDAQVIPVPVAFSATDAIGVSVEPAGGSAAPTGDIVLLGRL